MRRDVLSVLLSVAIAGAYTPAVTAASEPQLNFKIYAPDAAKSAPPSAAPAGDSAASGTSSDEPMSSAPAPAVPEPNIPINPQLKSETPEAAPAPDTTAPASATPASAAPAASSAFDTSAPAATTDTAPASGASTTDAAATSAPAGTDTTAASSATTSDSATPAATDTSAAASTPAADATTTDAAAPAAGAAADGSAEKTASKVLQGYVRVVPSGTKIPIIMDTAVDSDTSQEGDEFEARTSEDLDIDGQIAVPAGSVIKGRIASLAAPKHMMRSGSVALKFDTVTTPDNRQIPLVANLVAHGGVVHAKRGGKDYLIDAGTFVAPAAAGLLIGLIAGNANNSNTTSGSSSTTSKLGPAGGAMIGAGVGAAVGLAILLAKKGKKIDVRPGDELKIELAEDLRMPMM